MDKNILLACFEVPGWGGASTSTYSLFEKMLKLGLDVHMLNLISQNDVDFFRYYYGNKVGNPKNLPHVYNCFFNGPNNNQHQELKSIINELQPDIVVAVGWIASLIININAPEIRLILLTAGCDQIVSYMNENEFKDLITLQNHINNSGYQLGITSIRERQAIDTADLIINHSDSNLILHNYFFHTKKGKMYQEVIWFAEWIYEDALQYINNSKPFSEREIDVLFIASNWNRMIKNYSMVKGIINKLNNFNIHIIGQVEERHECITYHELITERDILFKLLGNTKTVASTSLYDAAPGILFEASAMGCNVVTSKNCGNWMLCNRDLLVEPYTLNSYLDKLRISISKKFKDNMDYFISLKSFDKLVDLIDLA